jgi:hypothetical protein
MNVLNRVAQIHHQYLKTEFSSVLGIDGIYRLYEILDKEATSEIITYSKLDCISAFCCITKDYKKTSKCINKILNFKIIISLIFNFNFNCDIFFKKYWSVKFKNNNDIYILTLVKVNKDFTPQEIINVIELNAFENKISKIWVDTRRDNTRALKFYQKLGFEIVARSPISYLLHKNLNNNA